MALKYGRKDVVKADRTLKKTGEVTACGGGCGNCGHDGRSEGVGGILLRQDAALFVGVGDRPIAGAVAGVGGHDLAVVVVGPLGGELKGLFF